MIYKTFLKSGVTRSLVTLLLMTAAPAVFAGQLALSFVDIDGQSQTLTVDLDSSAQDLAKAADLVGEFGVGLTFDAATGNGSLAEIGAAMAAAAPQFAADIAQALVELSPADKDAIVAAINAVGGVNAKAVAAAGNFGSDNPHRHHPSLPPPAIEHVPSRN